MSEDEQARSDVEDAVDEPDDVEDSLDYPCRQCGADPGERCHRDCRNQAARAAP